MNKMWQQVLISEETLSVEAAQKFVSTNGSGGIAIFIGTVRNKTNNKTVTHLEFEAYEPMAIKEMQKIAEAAKEKWKIHKMAIYHRVGTLSIGEMPVIIAVSSAHRAIAFEVCRYAIDSLKKTVPIWKKEFFEDGSQWVSVHP